MLMMIKNKNKKVNKKIILQDDEYDDKIDLDEVFIYLFILLDLDGVDYSIKKNDKTKLLF